MFEFLYSLIPVFFTSSSPLDLEKRFPEMESVKVAEKEYDLLTIASDDECENYTLEQKQLLVTQTQTQTKYSVETNNETTSSMLKKEKKQRRYRERKERIRQKLREIRTRSHTHPGVKSTKVNRINQPIKLN